MRGVNDQKFLNRWQALYRATCPSPTAARWQVADVQWRKQRLSLENSDFALSLEVHRLSRNPAGAVGWALLVAVEHWWDADRGSIKSTSWARVLGGNSKAVLAWMRERDEPPPSARNLDRPRARAT